MKKEITFLFIFISMLSCNSKENQIVKKANQWFEMSKWCVDFPYKVDQSTNIVEFYKQYKNNRTEWEAAYSFLVENNLTEMKTGRYELTEKGTYATVTDYLTKDHNSAKYEAHRKYIDIQYVASGEEYVDILPLSSITEFSEYDPERDIVFFNGYEGKRLHAHNKKIFFFFPENVHKPCLNVGESKKVRKIVVKIPVAES